MARSPSRILLPCVAVTLSLLAGCGPPGEDTLGAPADDPGRLTDAAPPDGRAADGADAMRDDASDGSADDTPDAIVDDLPDDTPTCAIPPRMRRLNRREYLNTIADLFAGLVLPPIEIAPDPSPGLFDNDPDALVPSSLLVDQYAAAALEVAAALEGQIGALVPCDHADPWCPREVLDSLGRRVFRRPLEDAEHEFLLGLFLTWGEGDFTLGVQAVVQAMLQSPAFLYRIEDPTQCRPLTPWETATRLSYALWATTPDAELLDDAESGALATDRGVARAARRLMDDPRFDEVFVEFFRQWIDLERVARATKRPIDDFGDAARASYTAETERFVRALLERDGTLRDLLTSRLGFVDARLARVYGVPLVGPSPVREMQLPPERAGFLTRGAFLAGHAHPEESSPILRGLFVLERLLCIELGPPPPGVQSRQPAPNDPAAPRTNREAWQQVTAEPSCQGCHALINPLGFAFEHYDTLGAWRADDAGLAVDASGETPDGRRFTDAVALAEQLAGDRAVSACYTRAWLEYLLGDRDAAHDPALVASVERRFAEADLGLRALVLAIVTDPRFARGVAEEASDE